MDDLIRRQDAIDLVEELETKRLRGQIDSTYPKTIKGLKALSPAQPEQVLIANVHFDEEKLKEIAEDLVKRIEIVPNWIPCSERLPEDIRPVIATLKNNDPKSYYQYIVGKHFIGTAHYKSGKWYWYSSVTEDLLAEYGRCDSEEFDEAIEIVAWMPLPEPYEEVEE